MIQQSVATVTASATGSNVTRAVDDPQVDPLVAVPPGSTTPRRWRRGRAGLRRASSSATARTWVWVDPSWVWVWASRG